MKPRAQRTRAHVVREPDYVVADLDEMLYGLGPNQATGTYDYCCRHAAPDSSTSITLNRQSTDRRILGRGADYTPYRPRFSSEPRRRRLSSAEIVQSG
jgi:hypothetical protein